jgi:NADPH:quinone reductase-like Zn-dependent oxidoreductase
MKAIVYTHYGSPDVLQLKEIEKPTPKDDELLIRIHAASVNRSDWECLIGKPLYARIGGLFKPGRQILGSDIAGRVEAAGRGNANFKVGDEVFGDILEHMGGFAEYVCVRGTAMALKPAGMSFEEASAIPQAGVIALQGICDKGQVQAGQHVLINGAGGGAGMFAVQLAKRCGAEVTAVDNAGKLDFLHALGADHVIDYAREDFTKNGKQYDMILDLIAHRSAFAYLRALKSNGRYYYVGGSVATLFQILLLGPLMSRMTGKHVRLLAVQPNRRDLEHIAALCESGEIKIAIDRRFSLNHVPQALRCVGEGQARGKVVVVLGQDKVA